MSNNLVDKYRPRRLAQVKGQDKAVGVLRRMLANPRFNGGAIWLEGPSGTGKTSIAQSIARQLGALPPNSDGMLVANDWWTYNELDGHACTVEAVRELDVLARRAQLFTDWRVWVVNESHSMTDKAVQAWLTLLERLPARWLIIFTTTQSSQTLFGDFNKPLMDRCRAYVKLTSQGLCRTFARLAQTIARHEHLDGLPLERYERLAKDHGNSMRRMLQEIENGAMVAD